MHGCQYTHAQPYIHTNTYIHIHIYTNTHPIHTHPYTHASVKPQTMKCASMPIHAVPGVSETTCVKTCVTTLVPGCCQRSVFRFVLPS